MIKLALQHKLLEMAIDAFFTNLCANFNTVDKYVFIKGQHYNKIETKVSLTNIDNGDTYTAVDTYFNCTIVHVGPLTVYTEHTSHIRSVIAPNGNECESMGENNRDRSMIPIGNITEVL